MLDTETLFELIEDKKILRRGMEYFRGGRIKKYDMSGSLITAVVSGNRLSPYRVRVELDETGIPEFYFCECPYSKGGFYLCKHIAAVLIRYLNEPPSLNPVENPLVRDREKFDKDVRIGLADLPDSGMRGFDSFDAFRGIASREKKGAKQRYAPAFIIEKIFGYDSYYSRQDIWHVYPAMRYIKKNGEPGRVTQFNEKNLTEPFGEKEAKLLQKLADRPVRDASFTDYADYIVKNGVKNVFLRTGKNDYSPVTFEEIKKIEAGFRLAGSGKSSLFFRPALNFYGKKDSLEGFDPENNAVLMNGFDIYAVCRDGRIFFKCGSRSFYSFFRILSEAGNKFTYHDIRKIKKYFSGTPGIDISFGASSIKITSPVPKPVIEIDPSYYGCLEIKFLFDYGGRTEPYRSDSDLFVLSEEDGEITVAQRNRKYESDVYMFSCRRFDFIKKDYYRERLFIEMSLMDFLSAHGRRIMDEGIEIRLRGGKRKISGGARSLSVNVSAGIDWFDIDVGYAGGDGSWEKAEIDPELLEKGLIRTGDSYTVISEKDIEKLRLLSAEKQLKDGKIRISKHNFAVIDEIYKNIKNPPKEIENIRKISAKLKNFRKIEKVPPPQKFSGTLRRYQHAGYNWLCFLNRYGLNGCLADDMGLGKTAQALALLQKLKEEKGRGKKFKTSLIVAPVSAVSNWEIEIMKFTPSLKYVVHLGQTRKKCIKHLTGYDIVIVSYHTLRNDIKLFNETDYGYVILDESQNIKNYKSLTFKAIKTLKSDFRLSLTGTPVENNTLELWSQMEFLNPGLLGTSAEFKRRFARPIEQLRDEGTVNELKKRVFPFILRRKKEDVLKELPGKSEIVLYSVMEEKQRKLYDKYLSYCRAKVMGKIKESGIENSAFEIFTALLKLRQAALFPCLADKKYSSFPSCKFEQAKELIEESLQEGHKLLLFSQFVESLKIIRKYIEGKGWKYSYLDGSVPAAKRKVQIKNFQEKDEVKLFLLSLKAGGTAINLTAADYVILFDPWWNPAVESQAVDRAHRIGQSRKVIAYKMIVKDSVEEKILELQEKKKELVENIVSAESSFYKTLTKEDIENLFS